MRYSVPVFFTVADDAPELIWTASVSGGQLDLPRQMPAAGAFAWPI